MLNSKTFQTYNVHEYKNVLILRFGQQFDCMLTDVNLTDEINIRNVLNEYESFT